MGALYEFDIQPWVDKFNLKNYVETGGGLGTCLQHAIKYRLDNYWSVELDAEFAKNLQQRFGGNNIEVIQGDSVNGLKSILTKLNSDPTLFFHDAHFQGNPDHHKCSYEESIREGKQNSFPLEMELNIIIASRNIEKDVFVIDDIALYDEFIECDWHKQGNRFRYRQLCSELGINLNKKFIYDILEKSHNIEIDLRSQGYLIATPKL